MYLCMYVCMYVYMYIENKNHFVYCTGVIRLVRNTQRTGHCQSYAEIYGEVVNSVALN